MKWPQTDIPTPQGMVRGIAPLVISASRATDIPAFHASWFMNRLACGWCAWQNPFNAASRQLVSFAQCRCIVFWSKNPEPLEPYLNEIEDRGLAFYFQFTLNDYRPEGLEPGLPELGRRIECFQRLAERFGRHRVVWRFDPIVFSPRLGAEEILQRAERLARELAPCTEKLVFSFVDWYGKTRRGLGRLDSGYRPPTPAEEAVIACGLAHLRDGLSTPLTLATCAEPGDFASLGIAKNRCIDPALLLRLCPDDAAMRRVYGAPKKALSLPGLGLQAAGEAASEPQAARDQGQRGACRCAPSKDIGAYNTCRHFCAYCYANQSPEAVERRLATGSEDAEAL